MGIKTVGVLGCGLMGSGIAQVCAEAGYPVLVREVDEGFLKKGLGNIERFLAKGVEKGKLSADDKDKTLRNLSGTTKLEDLKDCDIIIEAIVENIDEKAKIDARYAEIARMSASSRFATAGVINAAVAPARLPSLNR